LHQPTKSKYRK